MCPCESSTTLCVLPYLMFEGNWPQSWMHSYLCSPSPRIGFFVPALSSDFKMYGAATTAPAARNPRRVMSSIFQLLRSVLFAIIRLGLNRRQRLFVAGHQTLGMSESARALPVGADVEHDVVGTLRVAGDTSDARQ